MPSKLPKNGLAKEAYHGASFALVGVSALTAVAWPISAVRSHVTPRRAPETPGGVSAGRDGASVSGGGTSVSASRDGASVRGGTSVSASRDGASVRGGGTSVARAATAPASGAAARASARAATVPASAAAARASARAATAPASGAAARASARAQTIAPPVLSMRAETENTTTSPPGWKTWGDGGRASRPSRRADHRQRDGDLEFLFRRAGERNRATTDGGSAVAASNTNVTSAELAVRSWSAQRGVRRA